MINCVVVFGGESCEHDISVVTGLQVVSKLNEYLYNIIPIYIDKKGLWWTGDNLKDIDNFPSNLGKMKRVGLLPGDNRLYCLKGKKYVPVVSIDVAFVCLHGMNGEDGCVPALFELSKIAYSSSSLMASSVCLDKSIFKIVCQGIHVNVVDGFYLDHRDFAENETKIVNMIKEFGLPIIVKPSRQGSSVGIKICEEENMIFASLKEAFKYDERVVVEKFIDIDKEINIALFDNKGTIVYSQTEEPKYSDKILSFDDKYLKNANGFEGISRVMPAEISQEMTDRIKEIAGKLYQDLKMFGVVRFDFILSKMGDLYVNEVNTIPGSMANYLFNKMTFTELLEAFRSNAVLRYENTKKLISQFDSSVLVDGKNFIKK